VEAFRARSTPVAPEKFRAAPIHSLSTDRPHLFHRCADLRRIGPYSPGLMTRHLLVGCCAALAVAGLAARAPAQPAVLPLYHRLTDGTSVDAYGEWVRVGDRVVFSLALDPQRDPPALRLSSVPADRVDVAATERYREALRAATYAVTRGDADFDALSVEVARLLSEAARVPDAGQKLALAERARKVLAEWPATHHSYRLDEVRQIHALVDDVVADLRATRGDTAFDLTCCAGHAAAVAAGPAAHAARDDRAGARAQPTR
jgi:hypothetical protein